MEEPSAAAASTSCSADGSILSPEHRPVRVTYWLKTLQNMKRYAINVHDIFAALNAVISADKRKILG